VPNTVPEVLSTGSGQDLPVVIAAMPIGVRERRIAFGIIIIVAIIDAITIAFGNLQLARVDSFIPVIQTVMCVVDLVTAALLFAQYAIHPMRAVLAVASGYLFSGFFAFMQTLAFPGAYSPSALIGDGINSAAWIFVLWHTTFPLSLMLYAVLKDNDATTNLLPRSIGFNIAGSIVCTLAATAALTWLAVGGIKYLPALYVNLVQQNLFASYIDIFLWTVNIVTFVLLFVRSSTVLDFWLMIVLFAWWPNFLVAAYYLVVRFSAGWYMARVIALMASSTLLVVLLTESTTLYGRLANAYLLLRRERATLQRERENKLTNLEAAVAAITHEVRQPLTGISIKSAAARRFLRRHPPDIDRAQSILDEVERAGFRADEVLKSIRALFRRTNQEQEQIDANELALEAIQIVGGDLPKNRIVVNMQLTDALPFIIGHRGQLLEVLLNLIQNSIDAMRTITDGSRTLRVATALYGVEAVVISVEDSGPGIEPSKAPSIFDAFVTTKANGMGLGLAISQTIIERHNGQITVAASVSGGAHFQVTLPTVERSVSASKEILHSGSRLRGDT
jgi:signal transduction histidine kinase